MRRSARNELERAERRRRWAAAEAECRKNSFATPLTGAHPNARYFWLQAIADSALSASTKLVAHTLALYGNANGSKIFPGTRELARRASLSGRSLSTHVDVLVRAGWLSRTPRQDMGFEYVLRAPLSTLDTLARRIDALKAVPSRAECPSAPSAEPASARAEPPSAPKANGSRADVSAHVGAEPVAGGAERIARGAEANAGGAEPNALNVLKELQRSLKSSSELSKECSESHSRSVRKRTARVIESEWDTEQKSQAILELRRAGIEPAEIARQLKSRGVTFDTVCQTLGLRSVP